MNRMGDLIYLDNNATTQPLPEVVEAMARVERAGYANPSSVHRFGQAARHAIDEARTHVAELLGAVPREIVFTGGGTESINLAIRGTLAGSPDRRRIVTTTVEHTAVLRLVEQLEREGYAVDRVGVDGDGRIDVEEWSTRITPDTAIASLQHVNNETGVITDVAKLAEIASRRGVPVHVDAAQSAGKLAIAVKDWPVSLVSIAAHQFHGPKGVGALYVRRRTRLQPLIWGGAHERSLRAGTENVAGIVGMGIAAAAARSDASAVAEAVGSMRDELEEGILRQTPFARVNGARAPRIFNTSNISFEGLEAEAILLLLSEAGICASSGAACASGSLEPSHVLLAMGAAHAAAHGAVRWSLSRFNRPDDIARVVSALPALLSKLTALTPH